VSVSIIPFITLDGYQGLRRMQPGEQVPDLPGCGAQPVPFVVITQQHLRPCGRN
jgi:hypothetical protein